MQEIQLRAARREVPCTSPGSPGLASPKEGNKEFSSYQQIQAGLCLYLVLNSNKFPLIFGTPLAPLLSSARRLICNLLITDLYA